MAPLPVLFTLIASALLVTAADGFPLDTQQEEESKASLPKILYLTFDDGPNEGTPEVLAVLRKHGVPATFFINSINLEIYGTKAEDVLVQTIQDGHTLGDHSYDHMAHNKVVRNVYFYNLLKISFVLNYTVSGQPPELQGLDRRPDLLRREELWSSAATAVSQSRG